MDEELNLTEEEQDYYDLDSSLTENLFDIYYNEVESLKKEQESNKSELLLLLLLLIKNKETNDGIISLTDKEYSEIEKELNSKIDDIVNSEIEKEIDFTENIINKVTDEKFNLNSYLYSLGVDEYKIEQISKEIKNNIIDTNIDGLTFKDRINNNKNTIGSMLKSDIKLFLTGDITLSIVKELINTEINTNKFMSDRLVKDMITRSVSGSNEEWMSKNNIDKKIYCSILCPTTCDKCKQNHGKTYDVSDVNAPELPRHNYCKCIYMPLLTNWKREDKTDILYENYLTWKSENGLDGDE